MNNNDFKQNFINAVLGKLTNNTKYSPAIEEYLNTFSDAKQRQDVANGLNGGNKEILAKQIELGINRPDVNNQEQLDLARAGKFNLPTEGGVRQGGLVNGYNQGYNLNYDNPTDQISTRIGQALGTIKRGADSPLGRAVIAYGASRMMGDANPLKQAATAYGTRQNVNTANQLYRQQLKNMGIDTSQVGGEINADMYKNMIAGYNAGAKTITLQELANLGDERAINALANGANPYTAVNNSIGRDMLNNVLGKNNAWIDYYGAKTETENKLRDAKYQKLMNDINVSQQRLAIARQKLANGTISASDYAKELKNWTSLVNALDKYEGLSDDTKALVGKPPVRQNGTPAPQPTNNGGGIVVMKTPDGRYIKVPQSKVGEAESKGAKRV